MEGVRFTGGHESGAPVMGSVPLSGDEGTGTFSYKKEVNCMVGGERS